MVTPKKERMYEMVVVLMDGTKFLFCDTLDHLADRLESFREMAMRKATIKIMAGK